MKKLQNTVYVNNPDRYLSLEGENLIVSHDKEEIGRVPLHNIERIVTFGHAGASPALMAKCAGSGIDLVFMSRNGRFTARVSGEVRGNVLLRRQQYRYADDEQFSLGVAKNIISAKIFNSRWVLERVIRDHGARIDTELFRKKTEYLKNSLKQVQTAQDTDALRGIEGEAASVYFSVFDDMILQQKDDFYFHSRNKRPPLDNVNALLSFTYSMTASMCTSALESVGLDPYVGFMHTDRPGRCSLALDLMEEFRSVLCDRFVLMLINKRIFDGSDFIKREDGAVILKEDARRKFFTAWQKRKAEELKHPFLDEKTEWGMLPYVQSLLLARYIRGDLDCYPPFMWK